MTVTARVPGELSGSALAFRIQIVNRSGKALDTGHPVVNLYDAHDAPAPSTGAAPATTYPDALAGGRSADATFVFVVPVAHADPVRLTLSVSPSMATAVFSGNVS